MLDHRSVLLLVALAAGAAGAEDEAARLPSRERLEAVRRYIQGAWGTLTRSTRDLPAAAVDPKFPRPAGAPWPVYVSAGANRGAIEDELRLALSAEQRARIELRTLPTDPLELREHGLLYLPHPYVVPGGRFNEMYGWDSYFIAVGLLRSGELALARGMADNFVYEIEHYGTLLNANRSYYLTRSQPPFLTRMLLGVYARSRDAAWLAKSYPAVEKYYRFWTSGPHLDARTGLSRYWDFGDGPGAEVVSDEKDAQGRTHYDRMREYLKRNPVDDYDVREYYDARADALTPLYYKGDRSMRESGFDPSGRFGPGSVDIIHYVPVCLNSLLYQMELDAGEIARLLGRRADARAWRERARGRRGAIEKYLWDESAGLYFDYNFVSGKRRPYAFATSFYPLWVGAASRAHARRVAKNLKLFEAPGGLLTSTRATGNQWDAPYGWAPLQMIASQGLRRYGFRTEADRLARRFVALVTKEFEEHGVIVEKYDVARRESDTAGIEFGYSTNVVGFGWTNGVVLELLANLEGEPR